MSIPADSYAILAKNGKTQFLELFGGGDPSKELERGTYSSIDAAVSHLKANEKYAKEQQISSAQIVAVRNKNLCETVRTYELTWVEKK